MKIMFSVWISMCKHAYFVGPGKGKIICRIKGYMLRSVMLSLHNMINCDDILLEFLLKLNMRPLFKDECLY